MTRARSFAASWIIVSARALSWFFVKLLPSIQSRHGSGYLLDPVPVGGSAISLREAPRWTTAFWTLEEGGRVLRLSPSRSSKPVPLYARPGTKRTRFPPLEFRSGAVCPALAPSVPGLPRAFLRLAPPRHSLGSGFGRASEEHCVADQVGAIGPSSSADEGARESKRADRSLPLFRAGRLDEPEGGVSAIRAHPLLLPSRASSPSSGCSR